MSVIHFNDVPCVIVGDTETTGLSPQDSRICSVSFHTLVREAGQSWRLQDDMNFLINPEQPVPEAAASVNGFTWEPDGPITIDGRRNLAYEKPFREVAAQIRDYLNDTSLVFHNASFDISMLDAEFVRAGLSPLHQSFICTKQSFAEMKGLPREHIYIPGTNLNTLCDSLGVNRQSRVAPDGSELHGAKVDADLAGECFKQLSLLNNGDYLLVEDYKVLPHNIKTMKPREGLTP